MEALKIAERERTDQRTNAIRIARIETRMREQALDARQRVGAQTPRLEREPFIEHQRLVAPVGFEAGENRITLG